MIPRCRPPRAGPSAAPRTERPDGPRYALLRMSPAGRRFVIERLWSAHGLGHRLRRQLVVTIPPLRAHLDPVQPVDDGQRALLRAALDLLPVEIADRDGDWIVVADVHSPRRDRTLALHVDGDSRPTAVLKIAGSPAGRTALARERDALTWCATHLPAELTGSVPTVVGEARTEEISILALDAFDGRSQYVDLHADLRPERWFDEHLRRAGEWLIAFHIATFRGPGDGIPLAASHGDFWPGNVLQAAAGDRSLAVVDWEAFDPVAPVTEDLLGYLTSYARTAPGPGFRALPGEQALRRALLGSGRLAAAVATYLRRYCDALDLPREDLDAALIDRICREAPESELCHEPRNGEPGSGTSDPRAGGPR